MGYYTNYVLEIDPDPTDEMLDVMIYDTRLEDLINNDTDDMKWYDHDDDMVALSLQYPEYLFTLDGNGEESGDVWRSFYKNGKTYTWRLEYNMPDFDESKLQ